jgi:uncharacterized protein (DUF1697 family)
MPRYAAFLRAINVGGHVVKMDQLRSLFEKLGFAEVETYIASGNVIFETPSKNAAALEKKIAAALEAALSYEVATFLRTTAELQAIAEHRAYPAAALQAPGVSLYIGFLATPLPAPAQKALLAMKTKGDDLHLHGRELYWLGRRGFAEAEFSPAKMEKALQIRATFRNVTTVRKMAERYAVG